MIYRNAIVLVTLAVSSNAFWWNNEREIEPQPTVKQVPVGYFRTFTYQPYAFNPHNQYYSYPGGKMLQPSSAYSWPKGLPAQPGLQTSVYGQNPSHNIPQPPNTQNVPSPMTPTNTVPVQTTQSQQQQSPQPSSYSAPVNPTTSTTSTQSQPTLNEIQPPTTVPAQFSSNPHLINNSPIRLPYVPDPVNLQYITNVAPPLQHVQFVPCMCPVAIGVVSTPDVVANKRSDDIPIPADYRDVPMGEQSLSEER